jgi:hypothetical protein
MGRSKLAVAVGLFALALQGMGCIAGDDAEDDERVDVAEDESELSTKRQLQYIVTAHPDDEMASWSLIQRASANYPVFIVATHGEETGYCEAGGRSSLQTSLGEARPPGDAYQGRWSRGCKDARIGSWHGFLNRMADIDPTLSKPGFRGTYSAGGLAGSRAPSRVDNGRTIESRTFRVWADSKSARVAFDLGDGDLTPEEVTWAIQTVRARRGSLFPRLPEYGVIAASYRNTDPRCPVYDHTDHRAVHVAVFRTDQGTPGPQWGRTCIHDPDVARGGRVNEVDEDIFQFAMGVSAPAIDPSRYPNARRTGAFQVHYGWLQGSYWPIAWRDRRQAFWRRF